MKLMVFFFKLADAIWNSGEIFVDHRDRIVISIITREDEHHGIRYSIDDDKAFVEVLTDDRNERKYEVSGATPGQCFHFGGNSSV